MESTKLCIWYINVATDIFYLYFLHFVLYNPSFYFIIIIHVMIVLINKTSSASINHNGESFVN